ncbi:anti-sigma factor [Nocardiopsis rhodophaea]|uniref:Regulator of SigK n=1 Tax=Nocardiopsis rhodophaea TaxID=280238 RepID=A0ABN2SKV9_9ACTN
MSTPDHNAPDNNEVHGLTAAYAVDALTGEERERAERHLAECADCRRDLREFRATTTRLAHGEAEAPPERVWERLRAAVPHIRQLPPLTAERGQEPAGAETSAPAASDESTPEVSDQPAPVAALRRRTVVPWLVAAACLVITLILGGVVVSMQQRMDDMRAHTAEVEALLAASDARMRESEVSHTTARATVVTSEKMDSAMIMVEGLAPPPEGMGYQMWLVDDGGMRSAGMLEQTADGMLSGMAKDLGSARQIGITLEPASGMPEPSEEPMKVEV